MIESGIYQLLAADSTVSGMVGKEIHGVMLPKNYKLPAIVYSTVTYRNIESLRGPNLLEMRRFQFDHYGLTFEQSRLLSRAVRNVFCPLDNDGNPTSLRTVLQDGSAIDATQIIMDMDKPFEAGEGGYIFCAVLDVEIAFVNAA